MTKDEDKSVKLRPLSLFNCASRSIRSKPVLSSSVSKLLMLYSVGAVTAVGLDTNSGKFEDNTILPLPRETVENYGKCQNSHFLGRESKLVTFRLQSRNASRLTRMSC